MAYFKDEKDIRSMVRDKKMLKLYSENGFKAYGKRGSYTLLKREI
jgi:predicted RNA binding protein YcfA (HicA-like mRNA interferase family)